MAERPHTTCNASNQIHRRERSIQRTESRHTVINRGTGTLRPAVRNIASQDIPAPIPHVAVSIQTYQLATSTLAQRQPHRTAKTEDIFLNSTVLFFWLLDFVFFGEEN